jgi:hypothetical protein
MRQLGVLAGLLVMLSSASYADPIHGYVYADANYGYQAYLKTSNQEWHYDGGTKLGLIVEIPLQENFLTLCVDGAAVVDDRDLSTPAPKNSLGVGVVGQRTRVNLVMNAYNQLSFNLGYEFHSWFVGEHDVYGAAYQIARDQNVQQFSFVVKVRVF